MQIIKILKSNKVAFVLIALIFTYCLVGVTQAAITREYNIDFFYKWPMQVLLSGLMLNTLACTVNQAIKRWSFYSSLRSAIKPFRWKNKLEMSSEEEALTWLSKKGYKNIGSTAWSRKAYGLTFIVLFHISFILIGIGFYWSSFVRVEALLPITDGEELYLTKEMYALYDAQPLGDLGTESWLATIKDVYVDWSDDKGWPDNILAKFQVFDNQKEVISGQLERVTPLVYKGVQFNVWDFSYAPFISIKKEGQILAQGYVSLMNHEDDHGVVSVVDEITLPDGMPLVFEFLPKGEKRDWGRPIENMYPDNPHLLVNFTDDPKDIIIPIGQKANLGPYEIEFSDFRYMVQIKVIKDSGMGIIFWAFCLGFLGIGGHYLVTPSFASMGREGEKVYLYFFKWTPASEGRFMKGESS